jgi:hypothetical protein
MARSFTITNTHTQSTNQRPRSNALLNDPNDEGNVNDNDKMRYDPCRKATEREDLSSPLERVCLGQVYPLIWYMFRADELGIYLYLCPYFGE